MERPISLCVCFGDISCLERSFPSTVATKQLLAFKLQAYPETHLMLSMLLLTTSQSLSLLWLALIMLLLIPYIFSTSLASVTLSSQQTQIQPQSPSKQQPFDTWPSLPPVSAIANFTYRLHRAGICLYSTFCNSKGVAMFPSY